MSTDVGAESTPRKIAVIGSAPSSVHLAPFADPSWTIWGCSPGAAAQAKRVDQWFELHPLSQPDITPDYLAWMANINVPIALVQPDARYPKGFAYPKDAMVEKYGPYFFTSSVAWMLALAIEQQPDTIGIWGVDMAATEEYAYQRPGCQFFIREALKAGIKVFVPDQSDLVAPPALYGYEMLSPMWQKLNARRAELTAQLNKAANDQQESRDRWQFFRGALDDLDYVQKTWTQ